MKQLTAELLLVFTVFLWGSSYLFMKQGMETFAPFNLIALRFGIAFLVAALVFREVFPGIRFRTEADAGKYFPEDQRRDKKGDAEPERDKVERRERLHPLFHEQVRRSPQKYGEDKEQFGGQLFHEYRRIFIYVQATGKITVDLLSVIRDRAKTRR